MSSNLNMQSNFIEVLSKKGRAKKTKQAASDELDLALDTIEEENNVTLRKIKDQMASQVSDTDGRDARLLSTPELLEKCRMVITKDNPTGQSPGLVQTGPTMLNLLTRSPDLCKHSQRNSGANISGTTDVKATFEFR
jgi:hypothetical protein